ncbi:histidine kinase [Skermanella stibiiresistens SB22]|uniref:histidine kinase n=1 Tax=Skermanella stibiiresistens SB22 TaxID=1385369 RepID=W9H9W1_9PROT|nr:HAMP domain-containing sensor histidine kinase [Skermanella stibiiresistens]EWY42729.1 histidine kinase [Skermanella stibiiresistens SB22]
MTGRLALGPSGQRRSVVHLITKRLVIVAALAMVAQLILVTLHYGLDGSRLGVRVAAREAERLAEHIAPGPDGRPALTLPDEHADRYRNHPTAYGFQVIDGGGRVIGAMNAGLFTVPLPEPVSAPDLFWRVIPGGHTRVLAQRFDRIEPNLLICVVIAADPDHIAWGVLAHEVVDHVVVPMAPLALLLLAVNVFAVRRGLKPLAHAAERARQLNARRGGLRLDAGESLPREVHALVSAINAALGRADEILRFQREFTANVAHELRTPLAILSLHLDELGGPGAAAAKRDVQSMSRLVNQLLRVAQLEGLAAEPSAPVDLAEAARDTVRRLAPLALDQGRELEFENHYEPGGSVIIPGHADAIASALRNLVDNALRATPPGTVVTVAAGPGPVIEVRDQGPGIDPALRQDLFERFAQGDTRTRGSAGLGLAIVAKTMELHSGTVTISDGPGGGTRFRLSFLGKSNDSA